MLDIRRLEVLAAAVRERSIAGAARALGLTPSAASQAIAALEAQAGAKLLLRHPRGVVPTPVGERLALQAEAILSQLSRAEAELTHELPGSVRVAAFPTAVFGFVAEATAEFLQDSPSTRVSIFESEPDNARAALRRGDVDIAFVNHDASLSPDVGMPWRASHVLDETVFIAIPASHPLAGKSRVDLSKLMRAPWIMQTPASPCQQLAVRACAEAGFAPDVVATCGDYRSITALVASGQGVALIPKLALKGLNLDGVALRQTRSPLTRRINALVMESDVTPTSTGYLRSVKDRANANDDRQDFSDHRRDVRVRLTSGESQALTQTDDVPFRVNRVDVSATEP